MCQAWCWVLGFKKKQSEWDISLIPDSCVGKTSKQVKKAECAVIGSFNLLRACEKRSSNFSQGSGTMVLESGQRGELKTFQAKERMYKGKT